MTVDLRLNLRATRLGDKAKDGDKGKAKFGKFGTPNLSPHTYLGT